MPSNVNDRELKGNDFKVGVSRQVDKGVINPNPVFTPVNRISGRPTKTINFVEDPSVSDDLNNATSQIQDSSELGAELNTTISKQSISWLEEGIYGVEVDVNTTNTDIAATATGFTSLSDEFAGLNEGDGVWMSGFANSDLNTFYIVDSVVDDGEFLTVVAPAATESAGASVTMDSKRVDNGVSPCYNTLQTRVVDESVVGDVNHTTVYDALIDAMSLEVPESGLTTSTVTFMAEKEVESDLEISGQSYQPAPSDSSVATYRGAGLNPSVQDFLVDGVSERCVLKSMTINVANNSTRDPAAGCNNTAVVRGQFAADVSFVARSYISDSMKWETARNDAERHSFGFRLSHGNGEESYILVRQAVVTESSQDDSGGAVANAEVSAIAENDKSVNITMTVFRNWS